MRVYFYTDNVPAEVNRNEQDPRFNITGDEEKAEAESFNNDSSRNESKFGKLGLYQSSIEDLDLRYSENRCSGKQLGTTMYTLQTAGLILHR